MNPYRNPYIPSWIKKSIAEIRTYLGITESGSSAPTPTATNDFQVAVGSPLAWTKKTLAEVISILGISDKTTLTAVKQDADIASAISLKHTVTAVPIGHLAGLVVSRKDNDEVYISGGSIEVGEVLLNSDERLTVSVASALSGYGTNACSGGTATANSQATGYEATKAVDGDPVATSWYPPVPTGSWWQYHFATAKNIRKLVIRNENNSNHLSSFKFKVSTTGEFVGEEVELLSESGLASNQTYTYTFENALTAAYYRIYPQTWVDGIFICDIQMMEGIYGLAALTPYYVYVDPPVSGTELAAGNLTVSATAPTYDSAKGGYYHPSNTDQRAISYFTADGDGYVPTNILMYLPVPLDISGKMDAVASTADNDFIVGDGDEYDPGWEKKTLAEVKSILGVTDAVTSTDITNIVKLTQAEYDAEEYPDENTLYIIVEE
jgi:hypothetical protein